jgi:hypothetical protein
MFRSLHLGVVLLAALASVTMLLRFEGYAEAVRTALTFECFIQADVNAHFEKKLREPALLGRYACPAQASTLYL